jgi:hypothetical protein
LRGCSQFDITFRDATRPNVAFGTLGCITRTPATVGVGADADHAASHPCPLAAVIVSPLFVAVIRRVIHHSKRRHAGAAVRFVKILALLDPATPRSE